MHTRTNRQKQYVTRGPHNVGGGIKKKVDECENAINGPVIYESKAANNSSNISNKGNTRTHSFFV